MATPSIDQRYAAATIEKGARIQSRQFVQLTYLTVQATVVAALISGQFNITNTFNLIIFTVGSPCLASIIACWYGAHDYVIALLDSYCYTLEKHGAGPDSTSAIPSWYHPQNMWFQPSVMGRYWSNVSFAMLLFGSSLPGAIVAYTSGFRQTAFISQIILAMSVLAYRFKRLPHSTQPGSGLRYHLVTGITLVVICGMIYLMVANARIHDFNENIIRSVQYSVIASACIAFLPLIIHIEYERRRLICLNHNILDKKQE